MTRSVIVDTPRLCTWMEEEVARYSSLAYIPNYEELLHIAIEDVLISESTGLKVALYPLIENHGMLSELIDSIRRTILKYFQSSFGVLYPARYYQVEHHQRLLVVTEYRRAPVHYTKPITHISPPSFTDDGWVSPKHR